MKTIRNTQLFQELQEKPKWVTLFDNDYNLKDREIPTLRGGLDHIEKKKNGIYFYDIGCNNIRRDFVIKQERK
jgi:hypothetical protein